MARQRWPRSSATVNCNCNDPPDTVHHRERGPLNSLQQPNPESSKHHQNDLISAIVWCHMPRNRNPLRGCRVRTLFLVTLVLVALISAWIHIVDTPNKNCPRQQDICFVTCIFGQKISEVDQPANVEWYIKHWCNVQFLLVTNLPNLPAQGWTKIVQEQTLSNAKTFPNNFIVESRESKFLGWKVLPQVSEQCAAVIYMDGYLQPKRSWWSSSKSTLGKFDNVVDQVKHHPWGLSQVKQAYFNGLPTTTILQNLIRDRKDTIDHVNATLSWLQQQDDYQEIMPYYLNKYFAYDPNNANYRKLSTWFWEHYTTYGGLWRDQPLWAYTLHHFNCTPAVMTTKGTITKGGDLFEQGGTLGWDQHVYV
jgi:hypothetical protein